MTTRERYEWLITRLQAALGWQIEIEKRVRDRQQYRVYLEIRLEFAGKIWPEILRDKDYRLTVLELVKYKLEEKWDEELNRPRKETDKWPGQGL